MTDFHLELYERFREYSNNFYYINEAFEALSYWDYEIGTHTDPSDKVFIKSALDTHSHVVNSSLFNFNSHSSSVSRYYNRKTAVLNCLLPILDPYRDDEITLSYKVAVESIVLMRILYHDTVVRDVNIILNYINKNMESLYEVADLCTMKTRNEFAELYCEFLHQKNAKRVTTDSILDIFQESVLEMSETVKWINQNKNDINDKLNMLVDKYYN